MQTLGTKAGIMIGSDFSEVARRYEKSSLLQSAASEVLFELLAIQGDEDVLDVGCGSGKLTRRIRALTSGKVVGIDSSGGMIGEAQRGEGEIPFLREAVEELKYSHLFDVIFCNSAFQWFKDHKKALANMHRALRKEGRVGIQAPATSEYCPNFIRATDAVAADSRTKKTFGSFCSPWLFMEKSEDYATLFEQAGFRTVFTKIEKRLTRHSPDQVYEFFASGAIAGYLNPECYSVPLSDRYTEDFVSIVKRSFEEQADETGFVDLEFNRIYLVALASAPD